MVIHGRYRVIEGRPPIVGVLEATGLVERRPAYTEEFRTRFAAERDLEIASARGELAAGRGRYAMARSSGRLGLRPKPIDVNQMKRPGSA